MTDDQAVETQRLMPRTNELLGRGGVTFNNNFASYPLCCPSRATWLTGQYAHNHGVRGNQHPGRRLHQAATRSHDAAGLAAAQRLLHGSHRQVPERVRQDQRHPTRRCRGWSEWYGSLDDPDAFTGGTYTMYGYTLNENGAVVHYGSTPDVVDPATYQTDVYAAKAEDFVRRRA